MQRILNAFNIDKRTAYQSILHYGNKICLQLLETENKPFDNVVDEILNTKIKLLSDEFVIETPPAEITIPFTTEPFIYFLYNDEELVYIGKTNNISARIGQHVSDRSKVFNKIGCLRVNKSLISVTEEVNIYWHTPKYNIQVWTAEEFFRNVLKMCVFE